MAKQIKKNNPDATLLCDQWLGMLDELNIGAFSASADRQITSMNYTAQALMGLK